MFAHTDQAALRCVADLPNLAREAEHRVQVAVSALGHCPPPSAFKRAHLQPHSDAQLATVATVMKSLWVQTAPGATSNSVDWGGLGLVPADWVCQTPRPPTSEALPQRQFQASKIYFVVDCGLGDADEVMRGFRVYMP